MQHRERMQSYLIPYHNYDTGFPALVYKRHQASGNELSRQVSPIIKMMYFSKRNSTLCLIYLDGSWGMGILICMKGIHFILQQE